MLFLVLSCAVLLLAAYVAFVLFVGNSTETGTSLADYISEPTGDDSSAPKTVSKYCTKYEEPGKQLLILYGTEYGFSEEVAKTIFDRLLEDPYQDLCFQPRVVHAKDYHLIDFSSEQVLLCTFSTTGDGVPPTDSRVFIDCLNGEDPPSVSHLYYSVLALGDSSYPHYCRTGRELDSRLKELGAKSLHERADIDLEDWYAINAWLSATLEEVVKLDLKTSLDYLDLSNQTEDTGHSRTRPFMAKMTVKYMLTAMGSSSDKETLHAEFDLTDSGLEYTSGDALGIYPLNNPPEVEAVIAALQCSGDQQMPVPAFCYNPKPEGEKLPVREALLRYFDLKTVKLDLVKLLAQSAIDEVHRTKGEALLKEGLSKRNEVLSSYLCDHEVVDVLQDFSSFTCPLEDILTNLRALQPRYYSIASSPKQDLSTVATCAAVLRYSLRGRPATGVCTTYVQDRLEVGESCPVFVSQNPDFRLPLNGDTPIVMIGPGTGIAPFRAFIQERVLTKASGKNMLYFGCRHKNQDFLYSKELERWSSEGVLDLRTAFSRDQPEKVYVQDFIKQDGVMLWKLLQDGAHIYVCGDAVHMAGDVHQAILGILVAEGGLQETEAEQYMERLEKTARYQRDVWVT